jgi:hypothetical protein
VLLRAGSRDEAELLRESTGAEVFLPKDALAEVLSARVL